MFETFVAQCESCRSNLTVPVMAKGRDVPCPRCGVSLHIPGTATSEQFVGESGSDTSHRVSRDLADLSSGTNSDVPLAPIIVDSAPVRPVIIDAEKPRTSTPVRDADAFEPKPRTPKYAESPAHTDEADDDDVPKPKKKRGDQEDKTRWGTEVKPDPFTTSNPELLRNTGWIDADLIRLCIWLPFIGLVIIIMTAVIVKLMKLYN